MAASARIAALEFRRILALDEAYLKFKLRTQQDNVPLHEFFHRLQTCRICLLRIHSLTRGEKHMQVRELAASQRERLAGNHRRFRFHLTRMNRYRKRMLQEAFVFMEAFYWNASRAAESAAALGLLKREDRYRLFDAVKVRNKLIEHEELWNRPSMTHGENPALEPGAVPLPQLTGRRSVRARAPACF